MDLPVQELSDLQGLRVRSPGPAVNAMLEYLGASPVGMPPSQIHQSLERGALDGVATTWDLVGAIRLSEVLKHHTDAAVYAAAFYIATNPEKYDSLSDNVRQAIDETRATTGSRVSGPCGTSGMRRAARTPRRAATTSSSSTMPPGRSGANSSSR